MYYLRQNVVLGIYSFLTIYICLCRCADRIESCIRRTQTAADAQMPRVHNSSDNQRLPVVPGRSAPPGRRLAGDGRSTWSAPTIRRQPEYRQVNNYERGDDIRRPPNASAHLLMTSVVTCWLLAATLLHTNLTTYLLR